MDSSSRNPTQFTWSREVTERLIQLYENYPCLYVTTSAEYKNKSARMQAIKDICRLLNSSFLTSLTIKEVQSKIHGLRSQYLSEIQKIKKSKVSGASPDDIYIPKWQYFKKFSFLDSHRIVVSQGESSLSVGKEIEENSQEMGEGEIVYEGEIDVLDIRSPTPPVIVEDPISRASSSCSDAPKKRKLGATPKKTDMAKVLETARKALEDVSTSGSTLNSNMAFGQMLTLEMDKIGDEDILDDLKENIMGHLFQAKRLMRERRNT